MIRTLRGQELPAFSRAEAPREGGGALPGPGNGGAGPRWGGGGAALGRGRGFSSFPHQVWLCRTGAQGCLPISVSDSLAVLFFLSFFLVIYFIFQSTFRFTAKLRGRYRDVSCTPSPSQAQPPPLSTAPPDGTFVTIDDFDIDASLSPQVHSLHYNSVLVLYILWVWTNNIYPSQYCTVFSLP